MSTPKQDPASKKIDPSELLTPYERHSAARVLRRKRKDSFDTVMGDLRKIASHIDYDPAGLAKRGHQIYVQDEVLIVRCKTCGDKELGFMLPKQYLPLYIKMLGAILTHGEQSLSGSTFH